MGVPLFRRVFPYFRCFAALPLLFLVALPFLSSCADSGSSFRVRPSPLPRLTKEQLLKDFELLDENGFPNPPMDPATKKWPYGAFLIAGQAARGLCTAAQIVLTKVVISSHCLSGSGVQDYEVVFYDVDRVLTHTPILKIVYPGDEYNRDVAVVEIPLKAALRWHTVMPLLPEPLPQNANLVKVMSMDPVSKRLDKKRWGAMVGFKLCQSNSEVPRFRPEGSTDIREEFLLTDVRTVKADWQLYLDQCVDLFDPKQPKSSMEGNSGSLVLEKNTGVPIASLHWLHPVSHFPNVEIFGHFDPFPAAKRWLPVTDIPKDPDLEARGIGSETSFVHVATKLAEVLRDGGPDVFMPPATGSVRAAALSKLE